jgi:hypothetical protein
MTNTTDLTEDIIHGLGGAGYGEAWDFAEREEDHGDRLTSKTATYFAERGWQATRSNGDTLSFARFDLEEGCELMTTTLSGVICSQASFSTDRHGLRMFLVAAELRP